MQSLPASKIHNFHTLVLMIFFKQTDLPLFHGSHIAIQVLFVFGVSFTFPFVLTEQNLD